MSARKVVEMTFVAIQPQRPPKQLLLVDATLWNPAGEARWYLVANGASAVDPASDFDVDMAYVYELSGQGRIMVVSFGGNRGCFALCLPAGAHLELRNLPIELWGELPDDVIVAIAIGADLELGDQQIESWLDMALQSDNKAVVDAQALSTRREVIGYKNIDSRNRKRLALDAAERIYVTVPVSV